PCEPMQSAIEVANLLNTWFRDRSAILENEAFVNNFTLFPTSGYNEGSEIGHNDVREKYGLPPKERMDDPTDPEALKNTYISDDADWVTFETVVSTSSDQIRSEERRVGKECG